MTEGRTRVQRAWECIRTVESQTQRRVLAAFQSCRVRSHDLHASTGYGYDDAARDKLEAVFARAFQSESALVRPQLASGTHALWVCLDALLRPGDHLLSVTGPPYDTLHHAITGPFPHSLFSKGVHYSEVPLLESGTLDIPAIAACVTRRTRMLFIQRSKGYAWRPAVSVEAIGRLAEWRDRRAPGLILLVDNCYGEFVEVHEPASYGADIVAGSLIKNPGGTLAPAGGYVTGAREHVDAISDRVTAPGLGRHVGPTLGTARRVMQGLFMAPHLVAEALAGLTVAAYVFENLGLRVLPHWSEPRRDAVQAVALGDRERLLSFCRAVQSASPIDSDAVPEPGALPGYKEPVIMAAGTFVQGASSELSADGPMRKPYTAFLQGGTSREHIMLALERILSAVPFGERIS